ncbi:MAG: PilZ domain-containing protein [Candidatus Omnitrophica bacterium]|nr:PilZ domain-containing protein [Candidatus Omnitrophota bacterium]
MTHFNGNDRRKYVRVPFQRNIKYRVCYERLASEIVDANAQNISQNGIFFKTKFPPPPNTIVSLGIDIEKFKEYLIKDNLTEVLDPEQIMTRGNAIFGEVVRVIEEQHSGFYSVAVKLILKKDPNAAEKIEKAEPKPHPQYKDQTIIPEDEKAHEPKKPPHPQYIDPDLAQEDE